LLEGAGIVQVTVDPGYWTVKVEAYLEGVETLHFPDGERIHYATGINSVEVRAGQNASIGSQDCTIEDFLLGKVELFKT
jgi:hypothetical protein